MLYESVSTYLLSPLALFMLVGYNVISLSTSKGLRFLVFQNKVSSFKYEIDATRGISETNF
ncbi:MAG: hypothetical protein QXX63_04450, partial [Thermoplasmatales archaeon]